MWRIFLRPAMIVVPLFAGLLFPEAHKLAYAPVNAVRWALCVMIFNAALQIELADLKLRKEHFIILAANIFMGVVPFFILHLLFPGYKEYALAAFFAGITPTAAASAVIISLLGGKIGFALSGFALSNIGISLAMIGLLPLTTGNFTLDFCWSVAKTLIFVMFLPITAAQVTRKLISSVEKIRGKLKHITLCIWSFCLFVLGAVARQYFVDRGNHFAIDLYCQFLFRRQNLPGRVSAGVQSAAGTEKYNIFHLSGVELCLRTGRCRVGFLCGLAQCVERLATFCA